MKKLIFLVTTVLLLISSNLLAWEATLDAGYFGRLFNQKDQLGATRPRQETKIDFTNGLALNGNVLFSAKSFSFGPELSLNYGWANTTDLQVQNTALSLLSQYSYGSLNFGLKTGVSTSILTQDYMDKIDADTGFIFGFKASADILDQQRFFFEPQLFLTPSTDPKSSLVPSFSFVIGVQKIFKPKVELPKPVEKPYVAPPALIALPKEITPVSLPEKPTVVEEKKPEPVKLPEPPTPTQIEKPKPLVLNFIGNEVDPASTLLEAVIKAYNKAPSIVVISHKVESTNRANSVANHFKKSGIKPEHIKLKSGLKDKSIKISVIPKK